MVVSPVKMLKLHAKQKEVVRSPARFKVVRAGRRSGKTVLKVETLLFSAVADKERIAWYIAPTQSQARDIIWEALKKRVGQLRGAEASESRLEMKMPTSKGGFSLIRIAGWENRENFRGKTAHHIEFDEVDTLRDFFVAWKEIFRPALIDTEGSASFGGTPKRENPNLRHLEKLAVNDSDYACFHFTSADNPFLSRDELKKMEQEYVFDRTAYLQEIQAEYVDESFALFRYDALTDLWSNTVEKRGDKFLTVDVAEDGTDKTVFGYWNDLELYKIEMYEGLNAEAVISKIKEGASAERVPYSHIAIDAIGVGAGVASNSALAGVIGFKSSYAAIKTDPSPIHLPNAHFLKERPLLSDYRNLRSQCVFTLAELINNHKVAGKIEDVRLRERIVEELWQYQDASQGDGKRFATPKEEIRERIGRSPDLSDVLIMRMYFHIRNKMLPFEGAEGDSFDRAIADQFRKNEARQVLNETR